MFKRIIAFVFSLFFIAACSAQETTEYGPLTPKGNYGLTDVSYGSYVQWNDEYAVTNKHIKNLRKVAYYSEDYDLVFFKHPAKSAPDWTDTKENENLISKGFPFANRKKENVIYGKSVATPDFITGSDGYAMISGTIIQGMSGGPVFNESGQVVGINVSYTKEPININGDEEIYSVFLTKKAIEKEWNKYKAQNSN